MSNDWKRYKKKKQEEPSVEHVMEIAAKQAEAMPVPEETTAVEEPLIKETTAVEEPFVVELDAEAPALVDAELTPEEAELVEVLTIPEPTTEDQVESEAIGKFKVTSIRAHVYILPDVSTRPITAVVRGNLLPFFGKESRSMFCEVQVLNRRQEKVRGFIEVLRGKVIS